VSSFAWLMPARSSGRAVGDYYEEQTIIAIVDDDESVCHAIKRLVRSLGMGANTFASGQEFIDFIEAMPSQRFDCVILDVQMPGLNGLDVQERLKKRGNRFPIIFITAHDEVNVRERALAAGAVAFLRKPFNAELLIKTLRAAVKLGANA
jgi:FixJ family two-component response regulator